MVVCVFILQIEFNQTSYSIVVTKKLVPYTVVRLENNLSLVNKQRTFVALVLYISYWEKTKPFDKFNKPKLEK